MLKPQSNWGIALTGARNCFFLFAGYAIARDGIWTAILCMLIACLCDIISELLG